MDVGIYNRNKKKVQEISGELADVIEDLYNKRDELSLKDEKAIKKLLNIIDSAVQKTDLMDGKKK